MNKLQEVLEKLRGGEMALKNDKHHEQLNKALLIIWPNDATEDYETEVFYFAYRNGRWDCGDTNPCSSSITVTEFLALYEQGNDEGKGEEILVKREILEHHYKNHESRIAFPGQVYNAMQEYADLEIEKFARWVANSSSMPSSPKRIIDAFKKNNIATN